MQATVRRARRSPTRCAVTVAVPDRMRVEPQSQEQLNSAALTELAGLLTATTSFEELMQRIAALATRTVPASLTCGITLAQDGHVVTVASADALAELLDEQQYHLQDGPCLEALASGAIVSSDDLSREQRWDGYPARAMAHGVQSIHSSPLLVHEQAIGALNMYAASALAFDADARAAITQLTALAAATITAVLRRYDEATLSSHLRSALSSRSVIDQAIGVVIGMQHCGPGEAFNMLRSISQNRNVPLREVAAELVARTGDGSTPP